MKADADAKLASIPSGQKLKAADLGPNNLNDWQAEAGRKLTIAMLETDGFELNGGSDAEESLTAGLTVAAHESLESALRVYESSGRNPKYRPDGFETYYQRAFKDMRDPRATSEYKLIPDKAGSTDLEFISDGRSVRNAKALEKAYGRQRATINKQTANEVRRASSNVPTTFEGASSAEVNEYISEIVDEEVGEADMRRRLTEQRLMSTDPDVQDRNRRLQKLYDAGLSQKEIDTISSL